ncbi:RWD domain-containing protein, putative [Schistosoma mansoni]|uniref:RWD domain-containing protein, putative n=1 Tax=Schistosoma mansoni TaxID=6183 RepID=UPI00022C8197|nr:RWD domain-containing protein, putative [Schistosoma mansoni]|eukprot:XP_018645586.1 RWD domain-containing protein, putative [Schistosoma mansoni]
MNKNENHEHNSCIATTTTTTGNRQPYEGENFENLTSNELANFKATLTYWNRLPEPLCIRQPIPNSISIYKLLEKQIVKLTSDRGRIRKYLGNFTQTPEGLPFRQLFNEHLEMLKLTPLESNNSPYCLCVNSGKTTTNTTDTTNTTTHTTNNTTDTTHTTDTTNTTNTTTNNNDDEYYHYLMPAFYRLLTWLIETKRQFAIFIRTYGKDGEHILSAIEAYIHGKHSQEKAPINAKQFLPIDYTKWYLKRSEHEPMFQLLKEIHNDHDPNDDKQLINISKDPYEIYQIWSKQIGVINITDDFMYWKQHNYHYKSSKPLWFNPNDKYIQHILFDDNIRFEEDAEDCENELLALESIYEDKYQLVQTTPRRKIKVNLNGQADDSLSTKVRCQLLFELPSSYPNKAPKYQILKPENLSDEDISDIKIIINEVIERSLGFVMLFDILTEVQQKLDSICAKILIRQRNEAKEKRKAMQLEEEAKFRGDRVTVESFLEWNTKFLAEMESLKEKLIPEDPSAVKRPTGRELFLKDNHYDDSDLTFLETNGGEVVEIDEHLFVDIGDIDLDDDDDDNNQVVVTETA